MRHIKTRKKSTSFRLSPKTHELLYKLAHKTGRSQANVIEQAVIIFATEQGIEIPEKSAYDVDASPTAPNGATKNNAE